MAIINEISFEIDCPSKKVWEVLTHPATGAVLDSSYQYLMSNKELMVGTKLILGIKIKNKILKIRAVVTEFEPHSNFRVSFRNPFIAQESLIKIKEIDLERSIVTLQTIHKGMCLFFFKSKIKNYFETETANIQKKCGDLIRDFMDGTYKLPNDFLQIEPKRVIAFHTIINACKVINTFSIILMVLSLLVIAYLKIFF